MRQPSRLRRPVFGLAAAPAALLAALVVGTPARSAAQQAARAEHVAPAPLAPMHVAVHAAPAGDAVRPHAPAARLVAAYVVRHPRRSFPVAFTIADSAGRLLARYRVAGDALEREMRVEIVGADLVLRAETDAGPLKVVIEGQAEGAPAGRAISGRWYFQGADGTLQGRVQR